MGPAEWFLCIKQVDESKHKAAISKDINSVCHLCESWEDGCLVIFFFLALKLSMFCLCLDMIKNGLAFVLCHILRWPCLILMVCKKISVQQEKTNLSQDTRTLQEVSVFSLMAPYHQLLMLGAVFSFLCPILILAYMHSGTYLSKVRKILNICLYLLHWDNSCTHMDFFLLLYIMTVVTSISPSRTFSLLAARLYHC